MRSLHNRRSFMRRAISLSAGALVSGRVAAAAQTNGPVFSLPIGLPGQILGAGFVIRHGYACENTWYNPGWLHTGEDYYAIEGDTAGTRVFAVADGEIVFAGSEYPGLVVIVQHDVELFSMYGHLDHSLAVESGFVERGQLLGTVLERTDERAPSHLHFEIRTLLTTTEVNGDAPRYSYGCGFNCAPGPGYWPIDAPEHPTDMGWRNPTHEIARRMFGGTRATGDAEVIVATGSSETATLWSEPSEHEDAEIISELRLGKGDRYRLLSIATGSDETRETSAEGYRLWYRIEVPDSGPFWVRGITPSSKDTGSDGRASSIRTDFLPAVPAN